MLLFTVIWLTVTIQPSTERTVLSAVYGATLLAHLLFASILLTDHGSFLFLSHRSIFFWTAAGADLFIILFIAKRIIITQLSAELQWISFASIMFNAIGWFLYMREVTAPLYHLIFILLYMRVIWALIKVEPTDATNTRMDHRLIAFRFNAMARRFFHRTH